MRFQNTIVVIAATLLTVPAFAATGSEQAKGAKAKGAKAERKICRNLETTGSRMAKRACHTKAEWKKLDALTN